MGLAPGARLGPYEILAAVGAGGMGEVYRARDTRLKREVAIKILPLADAESARRFEVEAQAASRISHSNILAVYDVGVHDGVPYLVSELLTGETLRARLAASRPSVRQALGFAIQIAEGLAAAHAHGVVHRDLKPENLFVTSANRIKILDFGLAKLTAPDAGGLQANLSTIAPLTESGMVLGTAGYMAPEQVQGLGADHRSDIFAFGAVLYEMLSGQRAFGRPTSIEAMTAILRDEPPDLEAANSHVPASVSRLVAQCLAKAPAHRFQSSRDLAFAIEEAAREPAAGEATAPRPSPGARSFAWLAGIVVVAGALLAWGVWRSTDRSLETAGIAGTVARGRVPVLVVLPLDNYSADPEQEFFSDGMTEALIADLARVGGLRVISRTSAMTYKGAKKPLLQIARELSVDAVVEGSVTRVGDRVRISAQLIDGATERHMWSNTYERNLTDVLALQNEVARAIAGEIKITLTPQERAVFDVARPLLPEAHEAYLRGRFVLRKGTEQAINEAINYFKTATRLDPGYAEPYAGLAGAYTALRSTYAPPHVVMPLARAAAATALELDPQLAAAHVAMGGVMMFYDFNWDGAERELKQAIALSPNLAEAHSYYAQYLAVKGRHEEALKASALARSLDPLSVIVLLDTGWVHYLGRRYEQAIEMDRKALELDPTFWPALRDLGLGYEKVGRFPEAIAALQQARQLDSNPSILEFLAGAYVASGDKAAGRKVLAELEQQATERYVCPYEIATVHASLGDKKATMAWLEKGLKERADCMPWAYSDPKLDMLRNDPQFIDLMNRMGLSAR